jgi:diadenosine tetraphosphate (Ap4A) HIT family hydrolase
MNFKLDPRLEFDSSFVAEIGLSQVRLSHDSRYPWLILIPQINDLSELDDLSFEQQIDVLKASNILSSVLKGSYAAHKLNIAGLGNMVKQLHLHHVARFEYDDAWPNPIWGIGEAIPYSEADKEEQIDKLRSAIYSASDQK